MTPEPLVPTDTAAAALGLDQARLDRWADAGLIAPTGADEQGRRSGTWFLAGLAPPASGTRGTCEGL